MSITHEDMVGILADHARDTMEKDPSLALRAGAEFLRTAAAIVCAESGYPNIKPGAMSAEMALFTGQVWGFLIKLAEKLETQGGVR